MNWSTRIPCSAQVAARSARFSSRQSVGLEAGGLICSTAICHAGSCRRVSGIVEVFATVAQAADALAQERLLRMFNQRRIARIGQHLGDGPLSLWMVWVIQLHQRLDCLLAEDKFASAATEIRVAADVSRFILKLERTHVRCCNFALPAADASRRVR